MGNRLWCDLGFITASGGDGAKEFGVVDAVVLDLRAFIKSNGDLGYTGDGFEGFFDVDRAIEAGHSFDLKLRCLGHSQFPLGCRPV